MPRDMSARSPDLNAFAERFVRSIKEECLDRMVFLGQDSLRTAVREYLVHYHEERDHPGPEKQHDGAMYSEPQSLTGGKPGAN